jgi:hypothetical protein
MQDLMHDPVYKDFVFLDWQRERQQAALEIYQTKSELQQFKFEAQQSLLRAERLAAQLRALGIDPDIL